MVTDRPDYAHDERIWDESGIVLGVAPFKDQEPHVTRFSIIGSCVSRDVIEFIDNPPVGEYIARTSLASIASAPTDWAAGLDIQFKDNARPWHRSVAFDDLRKSHGEKIKAMADDYVLIDLIEERVYLVEAAPDEYITRSHILSFSSNFDQINDRGQILICSDDGFERWSRKLSAFRDKVLQHIPEDRLIIHRALHSGDNPTHLLFNGYLNRMYDLLETTFPAAHSIEVQGENFRAGPKHKWGPAPYHFCDEYYREVVSRLSEIIGSELTFRPDFSLQKEVEQAATQ